MLSNISNRFHSFLPPPTPSYLNNDTAGSLGTLFQTFITIGILCTYTIGITNSYPVANWIVTGIIVVFFVLLLFIEESPTFMLKRNNRDGAQRALQKLRGSNYDVNVELDELQRELDTAAAMSFSLSLLFVKANFKAVAIAVCLMVKNIYILPVEIAFVYLPIS